jgi:hypothetical protein
MARSARPTVVSSTATRNSSKSQRARSLRRQRTTPWMAGIGPLSTSLAKAWRCSWFSFGRLPGALRSIRPSGPCALKRSTPSRITWTVTLPMRAASVCEPPS